MRGEFRFIGLTCVILLAMYMVGSGILDIIGAIVKGFS
jgi:hypothetical protein